MTPKPTTKKIGRPKKHVFDTEPIRKALSGLEDIPIYTQTEHEELVRREVEIRMREFCNELEKSHLFVRVPVLKLFHIDAEVPRKTLEKASDYLMNKHGFFPTNS